MGEVSAAAEADGVEAGMPLSEALARCPSLRLVPSDPVGVAERWDRLLERLEGIGAAVESERPGEAFFEVDGLLGIHGGALEGVIAAAREAARTRVRIAVAPNRFAALARRRPRGGRHPPRARPVPGPAAGHDACRRARPGRAGGEGAGRGPEEARPRHPRQAGGHQRRPGRRPLRADRPAGAAPRPRRGHPAPPAPPPRGAGRRDRAARGGRGVAARPRPGAAGGPAPRRPRAAREDRPGAAPLGPARGRRQLERRAGARPALGVAAGDRLAAGAAARGAARAGERAAAAGARARAAGRRPARARARRAASRVAGGWRRRCGRCGRRREPRRC